MNFKKHFLFIFLITTLINFSCSSGDKYLGTWENITNEGQMINGKLLKQKSFVNSTTMLKGKQDKWTALEDAIPKCENKIGDVLEDYMPVN